MTLEIYSWVRREHVIPIGMTLMTLSLTSCYQAESVRCASGWACPQGYVCTASGDGCTNTACGNGIEELEYSEQCDDGNVRGGDGCSSDCRSTEKCGNRIPDENEICDDGNNRSGDGCSADCKSKETCGNWVTDFSTGEVCDDGNIVSGDGCSSDCKSKEICGNRITDSAVGEVCDDGNTASGDKCSSDCKSGESCGNGVRDITEECDDKNSNNQDGCIDCRLARCGDGFTNKEGPNSELCDYSDTGNSQPCNLDCTPSRCGDGIVDGSTGEECDHRRTDNTAECTKDCKVSFCGDGFINPTAGEVCDDGNTSNNDFCLNTCRTNKCGDGFKGGFDVCDDGNTVTESSCPYGTRDCKICQADCRGEVAAQGPYCGDNKVNGPEKCDDGLANGTRQCPYGDETCNKVCDATCNGEDSAIPRYCGDGKVDAPEEECDFGRTCGRCSAACKWLVLQEATGSITIVNRDAISHGARLIIGDGLKRPTSFELHDSCEFNCKDDGAVPLCCAKLKVTPPGEDERNASAEELAANISAAINLAKLHGYLDIMAKISSDPKTIELTGTKRATANQRILSSKLTAIWTQGMSYGVGKDCPENSKCSGDNDCGPNLKCDNSSKRCIKTSLQE